MGSRRTLNVTGGDGAGLGHRRTAAVFRAIQESLVNVMRHANATRVTVDIEIGACELLAVVDDDGIGIEPGQLSGDAFVRAARDARAARRRSGGSVAVNSSHGAGTRVSIALPLRERAGVRRAGAAVTSELQMEMPIF